MHKGLVSCLHGGQSFCYLYAQRCEAKAADHEAEASHNAISPFCLSTVDDPRRQGWYYVRGCDNALPTPLFGTKVLVNVSQFRTDKSPQITLNSETHRPVALFLFDLPPSSFLISSSSPFSSFLYAFTPPTSCSDTIPIYT